jgi:ferritin-like metal-binding protein YciE
LFLAVIKVLKLTIMAKTQSKRTPAKKSSTRKPSPRSTAKSAGKKAVAAKNNKQSNEKDGSLLEEFFIDTLKDIYWAEKALTKALPKMSKSATSAELKKAFDEHLEVTKKQIERLEDVFEEMGMKPQAKKCEAMQGLVEESESIISETKDDTSTRDAALIIAAQKVEHYEIASYGGLVQLAKTLNKKGIANTLAATLKEEKTADEKLTQVAEGRINVEAAGEEGEGEKSSLKDSILGMFSKDKEK